MRTHLQIMGIIIIFITNTIITYANNDNGKQKRKIYSGYIITNNGDTLHGKIQMLSPTLNEVKVKFIDKTGEKKVYRAKDVQAYSFMVLTYKDKETKAEQIDYVRKKVDQAPVPFGSKTALIERQVTGAINLYNHYVETRAGHYAYEHLFYLEKGQDSQLIRVNRANFKTVVQKMVADNPELKAKIGKKGYGYKHLVKIITMYNNAKPKNRQTLNED